MLEEIFGIPTHPLVIHMVVVLLPLASLSGAAVAVVPALRRKYDLLAAALAAGAMGAVPMAYLTGNELYDRRQENFQPGDGTEASLIEQHKDLANTLWPWPLTLLVGMVLLVAAHRFIHHLAVVERWRLPLALLASGVTLVGSVGTIVMVIMVGHAGSEAAWSGR